MVRRDTQAMSFIVHQDTSVDQASMAPQQGSRASPTIESRDLVDSESKAYVYRYRSRTLSGSGSSRALCLDILQVCGPGSNHSGKAENIFGTSSAVQVAAAVRWFVCVRSPSLCGRLAGWSIFQMIGSRWYTGHSLQLICMGRYWIRLDSPARVTLPIRGLRQLHSKCKRCSGSPVAVQIAPLVGGAS